MQQQQQQQPLLAAAPPASQRAVVSPPFKIKPTLLFEVRVLTVILILALMAGIATNVMGGLTLVRIGRLVRHLSSAAAAAGSTQSGSGTGGLGDNSVADATTPVDPTLAASVPPYLCPTPHSATYMGALQAYDTWLVLGNDFAAGEGSTEWTRNSYLQLLRTLMLAESGAPLDIEIILAAGRMDGNLTEQGQWLQTQSKYHTLKATGRGALVFVTLGAASLLDNSVNVVELERQLDSLFAGAEPVVPFNNREAYPLVLLEQPSAMAQALYVPAERSQCSGALQPLNAPSLDDAMRAERAYSTLRTLYAEVARRYGAILVETDRALGQFSAGAAVSAEQSLFSADNCETYNNRGHVALSELLAQCLAHKAYSASA